MKRTLLSSLPHQLPSSHQSLHGGSWMSCLFGAEDRIPEPRSGGWGAISSHPQQNLGGRKESGCASFPAAPILCSVVPRYVPQTLCAPLENAPLQRESLAVPRAVSLSSCCQEMKQKSPVAPKQPSGTLTWTPSSLPAPSPPQVQGQPGVAPGRPSSRELPAGEAGNRGLATRHTAEAGLQRKEK